MRVLILIALIIITIVLCNLRVAFEKLAVELQSPSRVTEVVSYNRFDVASYGTINVDDKSIDFPPAADLVARNNKGQRVNLAK